MSASEKIAKRDNRRLSRPAAEATRTACKNFLVAMRWPDGVRCPRCGVSERVYKLKKPFSRTCCNAACGGRKGYHFSVLTRTIFENTKISLKLWFKVAYLLLTSKKGISALQVHRMIFGEESTHAYHTSWMVMRWRAAMKGNAFPLTGEVEVDETYIGGKDRNRHWNKKSAQVRKAKGPQPLGDAVGFDKVGVVGAIARKGNVVCKVIGGMGAETLAVSFATPWTARSPCSRPTRRKNIDLSISGCAMKPSSTALASMSEVRFINRTSNRFGV
jgi:hypothetical protein